ncbi:hypothetical protein LCGC14_1113870 [marine sediment metagenome]|uniref:Phage tail collar domain-containing protein n=1 Tax=marine sediment metagenome TaxID=412755 RepID=A0A0F9MAR7_9ZZZZ
MGDSRNVSEQIPFVQLDLVAGLIMSWNGAIGAVPLGWALCDGEDGTPDLTDKFVIGVGDTYVVGEEGGQVLHDHAVTINLHNHANPFDAGPMSGAGATSHDRQWTNQNDFGDTSFDSDLPPYYAFAYIMFLG